MSGEGADLSSLAELRQQLDAISIQIRDLLSKLLKTLEIDLNPNVAILSLPLPEEGMSSRNDANVASSAGAIVLAIAPTPPAANTPT